MPTPFYSAYIASMAQAPVDEWREGYQAASDDFWDNTSTVKTIQAQTALGSTAYASEEVQLTSILDPKTGKDIGDFWREIVHKTYLTATNYVGKYYQFDNATWLTTNTNTRVGSVKTSIIRKCNQTLKWVTASGTLKQWKCAFSSDFNYVSPDYGTMGVPEVKADAVIYVQQNAETKTIPLNQRFLFDGKAYITVQTNPHIVDSYLILYVNATQLQDGDDTVNNIANANGLTPTASEAKILPQKVKILQGETQTYSVYNYIGGIANADTFAISGTSAPTTNYELTVVDGNHFSVKNKTATSIPLIIHCVDNADSSITADIVIWLGGVY